MYNIYKNQIIFGVVSIILLVFAQMLFAQDVKKEPRYSNKGIKFSIGSNNQKVISERNLEKGEGGALSLGYGFSDNFSMWLSVSGAEHLIRDTEIESELGGLELQMQHKFNTDEALQPYTKLGVGVYGLEEKGSDISLIGTGVTIGLGFDYFFNRHIGIGAEIALKKLDFIAKEVDAGGSKNVTDLEPHLNGDTSAFMINLVIQ